MCNWCRARVRPILTLMLAITVVACSETKQRTLLETIPAASSVILRIDADGLLKMAGCQSHNGVIKLTADIDSLGNFYPDAHQLLRQCASMGPEIDLTSLYVICYDSCWVATAPIKDESSRLYDGDHRKVKGLGHFFETADGDISMIAFGSQLWMKHKRCNPASSDWLIDMIHAADKAPVSQCTQVSDFLARGEALVSGYVAVPRVRNPLGQDFNSLLARVEGSDRQLMASVRMMRNGFPVDAVDSLKAIDHEALDYMPAATMASFAIGLGEGAIERLMPWARQFPLASQLAINAVTALADPAGGTMALGIAPGGSAETIKRLTLDNWLFKAVLPIADKGEYIADIINRVINEKLYSESDSAYLAITNYDPDVYPADYQVPAIPGAMMQARMSIDYNGQVMKAFRLSSGYLAEAWGADSLLFARVRLQGPSQYLLPRLLHDLSLITRR